MTLPRRFARLAAVPVVFALAACSDPIGPTDRLEAPKFPTLEEFPTTTVQPAPPATDTLPRTVNFRPFDMRRER